MTIYKRGRCYWTDFSVDGRRYRLPLKATSRQEAANFEKLKIAEAQSHGGLLPSKATKLTLAEAAEPYLRNREAEVSASTMRLERYALGQLEPHFGTMTLGSITIEHLAGYVRRRKASNVGNRSINIELGVLRRVMKQLRLWSRVEENYKPLPEPKDIGRALSAEQEQKLFNVASSRSEWTVAFLVALITANTTACGVELRNIQMGDINLKSQTLAVRVGKNRFRTRTIPLNQAAFWAVEQLMARARSLGAISLDHYLIPSRVSGKKYDPAQPASPWGWRKAWRKLTTEAGLQGLRLHDLRHHAVTKLAESAEASESTIMAIAGHVSREMLAHYSHIRQQAKRKAVDALDDVTITSQLPKWKAEADERQRRKLERKNGDVMVGAEGFEPPALCSQSRCATRLRYAPTC